MLLRREKGFTLFELLVTMIIIGCAMMMVLTVIGIAYEVTSSSNQQVEESLEKKEGALEKTIREEMENKKKIKEGEKL